MAWRYFGAVGQAGPAKTLRGQYCWIARMEPGMCFIDMNQFTVGQTVQIYGNTFKETLHKTNLCKRNMGHDPHTKTPLRSQDCSWVSKPGHLWGHRTPDKYKIHTTQFRISFRMSHHWEWILEPESSWFTHRSIRTQVRTLDTNNTGQWRQRIIRWQRVNSFIPQSTLIQPSLVSSQQTQPVIMKGTMKGSVLRRAHLGV